MNIKHWILFNYAVNIIFYVIPRARSSIKIRFKKETMHIRYKAANHSHFMRLKINRRSRRPSWCKIQGCASNEPKNCIDDVSSESSYFFSTHVLWHSISCGKSIDRWSVHSPSTVFPSLVNAYGILFLLAVKFICNILLIIVTCY